MFVGFDLNLKIENKFRYTIEIINHVLLLDDELFDFFFKINDNYGFYPIRLTITRLNDMKNTIKYNKKLLKKELKNLKKIEFLFDAKYDDGLYKNNIKIPNVAYHLSPSKNRENILKNGLYPKSNSRKVNHKDRVYIFLNYNDYNDLLKALKLNDNMNNNKQKCDLYVVYLQGFLSVREV